MFQITRYVSTRALNRRKDSVAGVEGAWRKHKKVRPKALGVARGWLWSHRADM